MLARTSVLVCAPLHPPRRSPPRSVVFEFVVEFVLELVAWHPRASFSRSSRSEGNEAFKSNLFHDAVLHYTRVRARGGHRRAEEGRSGATSRVATHGVLFRRPRAGPGPGPDERDPLFEPEVCFLSAERPQREPQVARVRAARRHSPPPSVEFRVPRARRAASRTRSWSAGRRRPPTPRAASSSTSRSRRATSASRPPTWAWARSTRRRTRSPSPIVASPAATSSPSSSGRSGAPRSAARPSRACSSASSTYVACPVISLE